MKRILLLLGLLVGAVGLRAETNAYAFETLSIGTNTVVGFTTSNLILRAGVGRGGSSKVICTTETDSVRFRVDGSSPTASVGHKIAANSSATISGYDNIRAARFLGVGTTTATWQCSFETGFVP